MRDLLPPAPRAHPRARRARARAGAHIFLLDLEKASPRRAVGRAGRRARAGAAAGASTQGALAEMMAPSLALPLLGPCLLVLVLLQWVPQGGADMPVVVQSAADAVDPAERWFSNELDLPCAPGWGGFLCNEKLLPEGWVPTDLPPVNAPVRLNPVCDALRFSVNAAWHALTASRCGLPAEASCCAAPHRRRWTWCDSTRCSLEWYPRSPLGTRSLTSTLPWLRHSSSGIVTLLIGKYGARNGSIHVFRLVYIPLVLACVLRSVGNVPQDLGAPDRRSRIISTDPDHIFHSRVVQLTSELKNEITSQFEKIISEWIGQPVVYSAGFGARTYLRNATFAAHVDRAFARVDNAQQQRSCFCEWQ